MDGKCGATGAGERSEHAPGVRRFTVHCIVALGKSCLVNGLLHFMYGFDLILCDPF